MRRFSFRSAEALRTKNRVLQGDRSHMAKKNTKRPKKYVFFYGLGKQNTEGDASMKAQRSLATSRRALASVVLIP